MFKELTCPLLLLGFALLALQVQCYPTIGDGEVKRQCLNSNNITEAELEALEKRHSSEEDFDNIDRKHKCYIHCVLREMSYLNENDALDMKAIDEGEKLSDSSREILVECNKMHEEIDDVCEHAFQLMVCVFDNMHDDSEGKREDLIE